MVCTVHRIFSGDTMEEDGMRWTSGTCDVEKKFIQDFGEET